MMAETAPDSRLSKQPDPAILALARVLARQAAREDHAREEAERRNARGDLRPVLDRPAE